MRALDMEAVKQTELAILLELDAICREHRLTYLLAYGTALGAARHGGFIPWDDDVDVIMPRDDYERLHELFESGAVRSRYRLTTYRDRSSTYSFFKLTDPDTLVVESYLRREYASGLWVDIFPLEHVSHTAEVRGVWRACSRLLFLKAQRVANPDVGTSRGAIALKRVIAPLVRQLDPHRLARRIEQKARSLNDPGAGRSEKSWWACMDDLSAESCLYPSDMLLPAGSALFEGHELPVPRDLDGYLTHCYKNWRDLPPESERRPHFPEAYSLEDERGR